MASSDSSSSVRVSFPVLLALLFIALKLIPGNAVNDWPWLWVLSPIWIPFVVVGAFLLLTFIVLMIREATRKS